MLQEGPKRKAQTQQPPLRRSFQSLPLQARKSSAERKPVLRWRKMRKSGPHGPPGSPLPIREVGLSPRAQPSFEPFRKRRGCHRASPFQLSPRAGWAAGKPLHADGSVLSSRRLAAIMRKGRLKVQSADFEGRLGRFFVDLAPVYGSAKKKVASRHPIGH